VPRVALLALAVGLVLADSSVVTLGLPGVLEDFDASPQGVSWVLTGYNLALALAAVPAALLVRRTSTSTLAAAGLVVFAVASLLCAIAPSLGVLVAARCLQGLGGAAVACAALDLLVAATGSRARGTAVWGAAGALGAAIGPAAGGLLTEALSWEAIFAVQVPLALACLGGVAWRGAGAPAAPVAVASPGRPRWAELAALFFLGAGLTAALFLLVLLLISGWRESPVVAALTVSVMPVAALLASRARGLGVRARGAAGAVLVAGGLAALGLMPGAQLGWTIVPQVLVGLGLGLSLAALTEAALERRDPLVLHGGWTIAARHAGVVAALALLTPIFTADLERQEDRAAESVLALLLDSPLGVTTKVDLGLELAELLGTAEGEVPEVAPAFAEAQPTPEERPTFAGLEARVEDELDRAATTAFERSFLIAAALSLGALLPLLLTRRRDGA
jgi:MFS family permease